MDDELIQASFILSDGREVIVTCSEGYLSLEEVPEDEEDIPMNE